MKAKSIYAILGAITMQLGAIADTTIYLAALSQIESGGRDHKIGACGERSQYQLMKSAWDEIHPTLAFTKCKGKIATHTATAHAVRIQRRLYDQFRHDCSPAQFYCAWNMGFTGFRKRGFLVSSCPRVVQERAERFANLVAALKEETR